MTSVLSRSNNKVKMFSVNNKLLSYPRNLLLGPLVIGFHSQVGYIVALYILGVTH